MKIIAYFLPQFHEIKENNEWWGKGFTEWTNVKKGKKLFKGHNQPKVPLGNNYYDLSEKETMIWQTELAKKYGIDGFCYYHYWFSGRKILEKPAENLLKWKDINQNFCFCWANHDWRKTWNGTNEILIKQTYGDIEEWENHFQYLLPFFKDERYIKIDNKPVFMFFSSKNIEKNEKRVDYYNKRCRENGFDGIYIIESLNLKNEKNHLKNSEAVVLREPSIAWDKQNIFIKILHQLKRKFRKNYLYFPSKYKFSSIAQKSLSYAKAFESEKTIFLGSFTEWDSTTRHGRRGYIINHKNKEEFKDYLNAQFEIASKKKIEYIFMNAWNEWAEGMYLEPDEENKFYYLETIKEVKEKWQHIL